MTGHNCSCGARDTTCGAQFKGGPYVTCPICGRALGGGAVEVALPFPEELSTLRRHYREACLTLATQLAFELRASRVTGEAAWDAAERSLLRFHAPEVTPHAWLFHTRWPLALSDSVDDALDERTDGSFGWSIPDPASASRAVATHDVLATLGAILSAQLE
jgi:hypothetical protein